MVNGDKYIFLTGKGSSFFSLNPSFNKSLCFECNSFEGGLFWEKKKLGPKGMRRGRRKIIRVSCFAYNAWISRKPNTIRFQIKRNFDSTKQSEFGSGLWVQISKFNWLLYFIDWWKGSLVSELCRIFYIPGDICLRLGRTWLFSAETL